MIKKHCDQKIEEFLFWTDSITPSCLWPSSLSSCSPTSRFIFLHTQWMVQKEATVNFFQRKEARVKLKKSEIYREWPTV